MKSTPLLSSSSSFSRSAIHPSTPINGVPSLLPSFLFFFFNELKYLIRCHTLLSAFSLIAHVLVRIRSASSNVSHNEYPAVNSTDRTTSLSARFIWHPWVSMKNLRSFIFVAVVVDDDDGDDDDDIRLLFSWWYKCVLYLWLALLLLLIFNPIVIVIVILITTHNNDNTRNAIIF